MLWQKQTLIKLHFRSRIFLPQCHLFQENKDCPGCRLRLQALSLPGQEGGVQSHQGLVKEEEYCCTLSAHLLSLKEVRPHVLVGALIMVILGLGLWVNYSQCLGNHFGPRYNLVFWLYLLKRLIVLGYEIFKSLTGCCFILCLISNLSTTIPPEQTGITEIIILTYCSTFRIQYEFSFSLEHHVSGKQH